MTDLLASTVTLVVAVDVRARDEAAAEHVVHLLDELLPAAGDPSYVASTHVVRTPTPHVVVVTSWVADGAPASPGPGLLTELGAALPDAALLVDHSHDVVSAGPDELREGLLESAAQHRSRSFGRLVRFPGSREVGGRVSVTEILHGTCIEEVVGLAGLDLADETVVDLGDFYRPTWRAARCTLLLQDSTGAPIPFEVRDQIACCSEH